MTLQGTKKKGKGKKKKLDSVPAATVTRGGVQEATLGHISASQESTHTGDHV